MTRKERRKERFDKLLIDGITNPYRNVEYVPTTNTYAVVGIGRHDAYHTLADAMRARDHREAVRSHGAEVVA